MIGLYFLLNLLLAIVYDNYKTRIETKVNSKNKDRINFIRQYYYAYDLSNKGYLNIDECKKFF